MKYLRLAVLLLATLHLQADATGGAGFTLPDPALLDQSEIIQRGLFQDEVRQLLAKSDFDGLEKLAAKDEALASPFGMGRRPASLFHTIVSAPLQKTDAGFQAQFAVLQAWQAAYPESAHAAAALAEAKANYAWLARGGGYADTVTDEGWKLFGGRLSEAADVLQKSQAKAKSSTGWYMAAFLVALGQSWDKANVLAMAKDANALHPQDPGLYFQTCTYLLPRWDGSYPEMIDYATKSADALGGDDGDILYARIAQRVIDYSDAFDIFKEAGFSWPRVKHGMVLICTRYPHSQTSENWFCLLATWAQDRPAAKLLFDRLGAHASDEFREPRDSRDWVWGSMDELKQRQAWANGDDQAIHPAPQ